MPTSNGLSYSMNSLPRSACTIGALQRRGGLDHRVMGAFDAGAAEDRDSRLRR